MLSVGEDYHYTEIIKKLNALEGEHKLVAPLREEAVLRFCNKFADDGRMVRVRAGVFKVAA